jgi:hypothetical protein
MLPQTRSATLACALGTIVSFLGPLRARSSDYELVICCQFGALAWTGSEGATHVWASVILEWEAAPTLVFYRWRGEDLQWRLDVGVVVEHPAAAVP